MTKGELIKAIEVKVIRAQPFLRTHFLSGLKHKSKFELEQILWKVRVSCDGLDISTV